MVTSHSNISRRALLAALAASPAVCISAKGSTLPRQHLRFFATGTLDIGKQNWRLSAADIGAMVDFKDNGNDIGPVLAQMISGTAATDYDMGGCQGGAEPEMWKAGTLLPWDLSQIPAFSSLWDWARRIGTLRSENQQIAIPVVVNADSMIYLANETGLVDSYAAVFDPKFKGRTSMEDAWINSVIFAAIFMKENSIDGMGKIANTGDLEPDELKTVMEFLRRHKRDGQFYKFWRGWEEGVDLIASRKVVVMTGWEPIVQAVKARGIADVRYATPKEGYEGWSNNLVLHRGAQARGSVEAAHRFANWALEGQYGCMLGGLRSYMVPTDGCVKLTRAKPFDYFDLPAGHPVEVTHANATALSDHVLSKFEENKGSYHWQNTRPRHYQLYEKEWAGLRLA